MAVSRPTLVWVRGGVTVTSHGDGDEVAAPALIGDVMGPGEGLEIGGDGAALILSGGAVLVEVRGTARCSYGEGGVLECRGRAPRRERLQGYREIAPLPALGPGSEAPPASVSPRGLMIIEPAATVSRTATPALRWRWSGGEGRFDLELTREDGGTRTIERWRGLNARELTPWRPLTRGGRYRLRVSLAGAAPLADEVFDEIAFSVLDAAAARAVDGALTSLDALQRSTSRLRPEIEVLKARLLESYGLLGEAARIWAALSLLYPGRAELRTRARRLYHQTHHMP